MSRLNKFISITILVLFILACNFVTEPINDVQNIAGTAQSFASALPVETLQALASQVASQVPVETFQALPSAVPSLEAFATQFGNLFNPQGTPVEVWREIPIMPQATAGQEFDGETYSFKVNATSTEVQDYYNAELPKLGWEALSMPTQGDATLMVFSKGNNILTITVAPNQSEIVVLLVMA
ncbi:MAG TPA: hypothetical protein VFQ23_00740 [Anaerolineales bacterium]|nr:hypothetical protein [Anaerolineales bacterium]